MKIRHVIIGLALVAAVAVAAPAIGGSGPTATSAGKSDKALKKAKKALKKAKSNTKATNANAAGVGSNESAIAANADSIKKGTAWAKIDAGGSASLLKEKGVAGVTHSGGSEFYNVTFDDPVTSCGWFATLNDNGEGFPPEGEIAINQNDLDDPRVLQVRTFDSAGTPTELGGGDGFSIGVLC